MHKLSNPGLTATGDVTLGNLLKFLCLSFNTCKMETISSILKM